MIEVLVICLYVLLIPAFWAVFVVLLSRLPNGADQPPVPPKRVSSGMSAAQSVNRARTCANEERTTWQR
ncbi:Uncharacterised protein [Clostridium paraputrificum]|nr:Uncharacterised protein [Clostridium paraputrificum]